MTVRRPGRPRDSERPDRVRDITQAAIELFGSQGYAAVSFAAVAREAGLTPAALYRYFDEKSALYLHAARSAREQLWTTISERFEPVGSLVEDFESLGQLLISLRAPDTAAVLRLMAGAHVTAAHHPELAPLLAERWETRHHVIGDIGRHAYLAGQITGFDDAEEAALAIEVVFSGLSNEMYVNPQRSRELANAALRLVSGLATNAPSPT